MLAHQGHEVKDGRAFLAALALDGSCTPLATTFAPTACGSPPLHCPSARTTAGIARGPTARACRPNSPSGLDFFVMSICLPSPSSRSFSDFRRPIGELDVERQDVNFRSIPHLLLPNSVLLDDPRRSVHRWHGLRTRNGLEVLGQETRCVVRAKDVWHCVACQSVSWVIRSFCAWGLRPLDGSARGHRQPILNDASRRLKSWARPRHQSMLGPKAPHERPGSICEAGGEGIFRLNLSRRGGLQLIIPLYLF